MSSSGEIYKKLKKLFDENMQGAYESKRLDAEENKLNTKSKEETLAIIRFMSKQNGIAMQMATDSILLAVSSILGED